ncbi:Hsp20/alpha crystallin family protein [Caldimonas tepidiphila]|uniref:Hsp20/alpha crystallin family protein n=1 Tax=Caldimonas tepidiphila TaxID=2315841 RepID=UPI000E5AEA31|nr:Hsp20/alpha crystallin family protein [Caldimonas tepidiphila]
MYGSLLNFPDSVFGDLERLRREFDDFFGQAGLPASIRSVAPGTFPALNIGNTPSSVEIYAFAPGLDPSKIDVTVDRGVLTIAGERPSVLPNDKDGQDGKVNVYSRERSGGSFRRAVSLPEDLDTAQVQASYRDGVLRVSIPRRASAQPRRIAIQ